MNRCSCGMIFEAQNTACKQCGATFSGTWKNATEYSAGSTLPAVQDGDILVNGDFKYMYNCYNDGNGNWIYDSGIEGWSAVVTDKTKSSYSGMVTSINGKPVNAMINTFAKCTGLTSIPSIPSSVEYLSGTFSGCTNLSSFGSFAINENIKSIANCFNGCSKLQNTPETPILFKATFTANEAATNAFNGTGEVFLTNGNFVTTVSEALVRVVYMNSRARAVCNTCEFSNDAGYIMDYSVAEEFSYGDGDGLEYYNPVMTFTVPNNCAGYFEFYSYDPNQIYDHYCPDCGDDLGIDVVFHWEDISYDAVGIVASSDGNIYYDDDMMSENEYVYCCRDSVRKGYYYAFSTIMNFDVDERASVYLGQYTEQYSGAPEGMVILRKN